MACNCGKRRQKATKEIAHVVTLQRPLDDILLVQYIGDVKDVFYGVVSGNRYVVQPGDVVEADKADCITGILTMPGLLENVLFVLLD